MTSNVGGCQWQHLRVVCSNMRTQQAAESRIVCMAHALHKITYTKSPSEGGNPIIAAAKETASVAACFDRLALLVYNDPVRATSGSSSCRFRAGFASRGNNATLWKELRVCC